MYTKIEKKENLVQINLHNSRFLYPKIREAVRLGYHDLHNIAAFLSIGQDALVIALLQVMDAGKLLKAKITQITRKGSFLQISVGIYLVDFYDFLGLLYSLLN